MEAETLFAIGEQFRNCSARSEAWLRTVSRKPSAVANEEERRAAGRCPRSPTRPAARSRPQHRRRGFLALGRGESDRLPAAAPGSRPASGDGASRHRRRGECLHPVAGPDPGMRPSLARAGKQRHRARHGDERRLAGQDLPRPRPQRCRLTAKLVRRGIGTGRSPGRAEGRDRSPHHHRTAVGEAGHARVARDRRSDARPSSYMS